MIKKILIVLGDPNSVNSEILFKSWKKINNSTKKKIYLISNYNLMIKQSKKIKIPVKIAKVDDIFSDSKKTSLKVIDIKLKFKDPFKVNIFEATKFVISSLNYAHKCALSNNNIGFINCAIDKKLLNKKNIGVTEYLAKKCNLKDNSEAMLIKNKYLAVSPITTHIEVKNIEKKLNSTLITKKIKTINKYYSFLFKKKPNIAVLGLNPHNSELRKGSFEVKTIKPVISKLKKKGLRIFGPMAADSIFIEDYKNYDVIIGMYHDQVLSPFKALFKFNAINITLGLKYLRISPDHGTAKNMIGKNKASAVSLLECIKFFNGTN